MVNVIDNGARLRTNMMPVGIKVIDDKGNTTHTAKTDLGTNYISLESEWFGSSSNNTGGSTGGNTNPNNPIDNGVNYVPGLLSDGTLTGRKLEWTGTTDPTKVNTLSFKDDLGTNLNQAGDGLQFVPYLKKILVTRGVVGEETDIPLAFDENNKANDGNYVVTQYLPISISRGNLIAGNELVVTFNGIGENDKSATELKSPELHIKYNSGNNSVDISQVSGYAYDNLTNTQTGERYDLGISMINTFYTQKPVAQLPSTVQLFSGSASGPISLSGIDDYYSNVQNGIEVTFDSQMTSVRNSLAHASYSTLGLAPSFRIPKEALIIGSRYYFDITGNAVLAKDDKSNLSQSSYFMDGSDKMYLRSLDNMFVDISSGQISISLVIETGVDISVGWSSNSKYAVNVAKVTPY